MSNLLPQSATLPEIADISITDLFHIDELQRMQDAFTEATDVASLITYPDGRPITQSSNFCRLCRDVIRKTELGRANCFRSDSIIGKQDLSGPTVQPCLSGGLWDAGASITVGGKHLANWLVGQVKNEEIEEEKLIVYAAEIGADVGEFRAALREVPVMSKEKFQKIAQLVFLLSNELSQKAFQNLQQARAIADRKRAEEAARHSEAEFLSFVENSPSGIFISSLDEDRFLSVNAALVKMLGYASAEELLSAKLSTDVYFSPDEREEPMNLLLRGQRLTGMKRHWKKKDGKNITVRGSYRMAKELLHVGLTVEGIVEDVTEYETLQNQLLQAQKMEVIGQLAGTIAHDFNNLLMAISGQAELLLQTSDPRKVEKKIRQILCATESAGKLTKKLLALSRKQELASSIFNMNQLVSETTDLIGHVLGKGINLDIRLSSTPCWVNVDRAQMEQTIINLVLNARDAMPEGGTLVLSTSALALDDANLGRHAGVPKGTYALLTVADTGNGIPEQFLGRVFEPFFTTKPQERGTGLGLSIAHGFVSHSGGQIRVRSTVGAGTTFSLYLPSAKKVLQEAPMASPCPLRKSGASCPREGTILVVDDEELVRTSVRALLEHENLTVLDAGNAYEGAKIALELRSGLALLVTDVVMPAMTGIELAISLVTEIPGLPIIFMSGYAAGIEGYEQFKHTKFLQKPFGRETLLNAVCEGLRTCPRAGTGSVLIAVRSNDA